MDPRLRQTHAVACVFGGELLDSGISLQQISAKASQLVHTEHVLNAGRERHQEHRRHNLGTQCGKRAKLIGAAFPPNNWTTAAHHWLKSPLYDSTHLQHQQFAVARLGNLQASLQAINSCTCVPDALPCRILQQNECVPAVRFWPPRSMSSMRHVASVAPLWRSHTSRRGTSLAIVTSSLLTRNDASMNCWNIPSWRAQVSSHTAHWLFRRASADVVLITGTHDPTFGQPKHMVNWVETIFRAHQRTYLSCERYLRVETEQGATKGDSLRS